MVRYTELLLSFPPTYSLLDSFLPDAGVNFDLVILKTEALDLKLIAEFLDFWLLFADFFYKILLKSILKCWNFLSTLSNRILRFMSGKSYWIRSKKLSLKDFLPVKSQKLPPFSLKFTSYFFVKMAVHVIVFSEHWTISSISYWFS